MFAIISNNILTLHFIDFQCKFRLIACIRNDAFHKFKHKLDDSQISRSLFIDAVPSFCLFVEKFFS